MSAYIVEDGIERPKQRRKMRPCKYPFFEMQVGQSFKVDTRKEYENVMHAAYSIHKRHPQKFSGMEMVNGTYRIWRME